MGLTVRKGFFFPPLMQVESLYFKRCCQNKLKAPTELYFSVSPGRQKALSWVYLISWRALHKISGMRIPSWWQTRVWGWPGTCMAASAAPWLSQLGVRQQPGVHWALSHCNAPGCWKAGGIWWLEYLIQITHPNFCKFIGFKTTLTPPLWVKGRGWRMDKTTRALAWDKPKACETSLQR